MAVPIRTVTQTFQILRYLAQAAEPQSLTSLSRATGISPSSSLNVLRTLVIEGVIEASGDKRYGLAKSWSGLSALSRPDYLRVAAQAQPYLDRFARTHDAAFGLWHLVTDNRLELIALGESDAKTRIHMAVGQRQPIGAGAAGRALAAFQSVDENELVRRFKQIRWQKPISQNDYIAQVEQARIDGYAIDDGYAFAGVCSVAAIYSKGGDLYSITASVFAGSRSSQSIKNMGKALKDAADDLS